MLIKRSPALTWCGIILVSTIFLALVLPVNDATLHRLHISLAIYHEAILSFLIPIGIIWFSAFYAYEKTGQYAETLRQTDEGRAFAHIARGLQLLAWGLAAATVLSLILGGVTASTPQLQGARIIIDNYATLLFPLVGFTIIGMGTRQLAQTVKAPLTLRVLRILFVVLALIGVFFARYALRNHYANNNPYMLPVFFLVTTIIVPYLYTWFVGVVAAYDLQNYAHKVKGVLYQQALSLLALGITIVIISSIIIQYVTTLMNNGNDLSFGSLLLLVYGLLIVEAAGYALIAYGARRLKRIEEV